MRYLIIFYFTILCFYSSRGQTAEVCYKKGNEKLEANDYRGSIVEYSKAVNIEPNYINAYFNRGYARIMMADNKNAISDFNIAIRLNPNDGSSYFNRALAKHNLKNEIGAIEDYDKAIALDSTNSSFFAFRGKSRFVLQKFFEAIDDFDKALQIDSNSSMAFRGRGQVKFALNDYAGAVEDYDASLAIDPDNAESHCLRGNANCYLDDYKTALDDYDKALDIDPKYSLASLGRMYANQKLKEKEWTYVGVANDGDRFYVKSSYLTKEEGIVKIWVKSISKSASFYKYGKKFSYNNVKKMLLYEIDCTELKIRASSSVWYNTSGNVIYNNDTGFDEYDEGSWKHVVPESIGEAIYKKVCELFN
jgi:tetratricopeptide (TPR) repeat protein